MKKRVLLSLALVILFSAQPARAFDMTILHVNDSHSYLEESRDTLVLDGKPTAVHLGGWPRLTSAVAAVRRTSVNVALLHAGDAVQGDLYFMKYYGMPEMEFLNRLDFDAMVLGNHEFDKGVNALASFLRYTDTPMLGANIDASGVPALKRRLKPYVIIHFGPDRVGIIGLTIKDTKFTSSPGPLVSFADEADTARRYVRELEALGVNKIILLTHVGLGLDRKLAATVPGVDVVVGGHSHSLLGDSGAMHDLGKTVEGPYPMVVTGADGNDVYVVTAWKWDRVLGRLDVSFDEQGRVTSATGKPLMLVADDFKRKDGAGNMVTLGGQERQAVLDALAGNPMTAVLGDDAAAAAFLMPYSEGIRSMREDVIGKAVQPIPHIRVPGRSESGVLLPHGSLLAPIVAQSMLARLAHTGKPADLALLNGGAVRDNLEEGDLTVGTAYTLLPFANTLFVLNVTGAQIRDALEYGVTRGLGAFPYVAGARYTADMTRPEGERITSVDVRKGGQWLPLVAGRKYRLVTNSYMANGGDGYTMLKKVIGRYDTGFMDSQAFIEYVKDHKELAPLKVTAVTYMPAR